MWMSIKEVYIWHFQEVDIFGEYWVWWKYLDNMLSNAIMFLRIRRILKCFVYLKDRLEMHSVFDNNLWYQNIYDFSFKSEQKIQNCLWWGPLVVSQYFRKHGKTWHLQEYLSRLVRLFTLWDQGTGHTVAALVGTIMWGVVGAASSDAWRSLFLMRFEEGSASAGRCILGYFWDTIILTTFVEIGVVIPRPTLSR